MVTSKRARVTSGGAGSPLRCALATVALAATVLASSTARAEAPSTCDGVITADSTFGALALPVFCVISGGSRVAVSGNVRVESGALLQIFGDLSVGGNVVVRSNALLQIQPPLGSLGVGGNVSLARDRKSVV